MADKKKPTTTRRVFGNDEDAIPEQQDETVTDKVGGLVHDAVDAVKGVFSHSDDKAPKKKSNDNKEPISNHKRYDKFKKGNS